jgi:Flp pilus assembly pilin Flp
LSRPGGPWIVVVVDWTPPQATDLDQGLGQPVVVIAFVFGIIGGGEQHMLITLFQGLLAELRRGEEGQTAIEYALVLALIAVVIVGVVATGLTTAVPNIIDNVTSKL